MAVEVQRPQVRRIIRPAVDDGLDVVDLRCGPLAELAAVGEQRKPTARRSYHTGRVYVRTDNSGRETYYGSWYAGERRVNRRLGPKRANGERDGLTAAQAETELRRRMTDEGARANLGERLDVTELGRRYRLHLAAIGRKKSTLAAVDSTLRVWVEPILGYREVSPFAPRDVEDWMRTVNASIGAKSVRNHVGTISAMYRYAMHRGTSGQPSTRATRSTSLLACRATKSTS